MVDFYRRLDVFLYQISGYRILLKHFQINNISFFHKVNTRLRVKIKKKLYGKLGKVTTPRKIVLPRIWYIFIKINTIY